MGDLRAESKNLALAIYIDNIEKIGDKTLATYMFDDGPHVGGYRSGPNELTLQFTEGLLFVGTCTEGI